MRRGIAIMNKSLKNINAIPVDDTLAGLKEKYFKPSHSSVKGILGSGFCKTQASPSLLHFKWLFFGSFKFHKKNILKIHA